MSSDLSAEITAIATALLAVLAVATAWYARRAFLKQSQEVRAIEQQVKDEQELTKQQAELVKVQSDQLELSRQQFDEQRQINARQAGVFELQSTELRESLAERKHEAEQRRSAQAARVFVSQTTATMYKPDDMLKTLDFDVPTVVHALPRTRSQRLPPSARLRRYPASDCRLRLGSRMTIRYRRKRSDR